MRAFGGGESEQRILEQGQKINRCKAADASLCGDPSEGAGERIGERIAAVRTPGAEALVEALMRDHPELVEPVEWPAEAVALLARCNAADCIGRVLYSKSFLEECGRLPQRA